MKKVILTISTVALSFCTLTVLNSCGNPGEQPHDEQVEETDVHQHAALFQCPMLCEGDKTYAEAGKCPSCGMDMEEVEEHEHAEEHDHEGEDHQH
jgi:hypothetical protein